MNILIRSEKKSDYRDIKEITDLAFKQENEGLMIRKLRENPKYIEDLSLVAIVDEKIVGHILFFPVDIKNESRINTTLSLAPISVHPDFQNKKIGSLLIKAGLKKASELGFSSAIVVGHANYYPRFGFKPASLWNIKPPFEIPDKVFMALELKLEGLKDCSGVVEFPNEYQEAM
jgi:predicted N-acetyltransferase YhbS